VKIRYGDKPLSSGDELELPDAVGLALVQSAHWESVEAKTKRKKKSVSAEEVEES